MRGQALARRQEVAAPAPRTGGGVSPLTTTTAQVALILVVVGVVGGATASWTLRTPRR